MAFTGGHLHPGIRHRNNAHVSIISTFLFPSSYRLSWDAYDRGHLGLRPPRINGQIFPVSWAAGSLKSMVG